MIIDIHTHTFPEKIAAGALKSMEQDISRSQGFEVIAPGKGTYEDLSQSSIANGIDLSIVLPVATNIRQPEKINRLSVALNEKAEEKHVFNFGAIHPDCENYKQILDEIVAMDLKGIKLHPDYQQTDFDDEKYIRIMDYAANKGLAIVAHAGEDVGLPETVHCTPDKVLNVWKHIQPEKLVLAHMGGWRKWDEVEEKIIGLPVYFDTAVCLNQKFPVYIEDEQFVRMVRKQGVERVMFGTDLPWYSQEDALRDIRKTSLTEEELKLVLGENAQRVLLGT